MIKNERQYKIAKSQLEKFSRSVEDIVDKKNNNLHPLLIKAQKDALESQLEEIKKEMEEYDQLKKSRPPMLELQSIEDLPKILIKTRISLRLSQKDLAKMIGLKEQQIQRYEATDYATASIAKIREISESLSLKIRENFKINENKIPLNQFFKKLIDVGIDKQFLTKKILPSRITYALENQYSDTIPNLAGLQAAAMVGRIFNVEPEQILAQREPIQIAPITNVMFKKPKNVNEVKLNAYTIYAHYLSMLIIQATKHLPKKSLPKEPNPYEIHKSIIDKYHSMTFENLVRYLWDQGIPVLALDDSGSFHGACFHEDDRHVIILKQNTNSISRWMFDLLHEYWHVITRPSQQTVHALSDHINEHQKNDIEKEASQFAAATLLGKNPHELIEKCLVEANRDIKNLKDAIPKVAKKENVSPSILANCVAFRLSQENYNIWGVATKLQEIQKNPKKIIRDILLENIDFSSLSAPDLELLRQALIYEEGITNE